jgi:hypothetical protein
MRKFFLLFFLLISVLGRAQIINCTIADSASGEPLMYATVIFKMKSVIKYAGEDGKFSFNKDSVNSNDTIIAGYVGYNDYLIPVSKITNGYTIKMLLSARQLQPVVVSNCTKYKARKVNKPQGRIDQFTGPGPETRIILISRFTNDQNVHGFIKSIEIYAGAFNETVKVPVRLHWYKWDEKLQEPGEELTDRNLLIYPYKKGWNEFTMPEKLFWYSKDGVVLGLEFIYPVDFVKQYQSITAAREKIKWLQDMNHRWSLGMKFTNEKTANTFYIMNNNPIQVYKKAGDNLYWQPAIKFNVLVCKKG